MEFVILSENEFEKIQNDMPGSSYYQTTTWARIKKSNGWEAHYVAVKKDSEFCGAALLLARKVVMNKKIFYAPRGLMLKYDEEDILDFFIRKVKKYVKDNNGFMLKIDPLVEYVHHDSDGAVINDGFSNEKVHEHMLKLGFKHKGFRTGYVDDLQYRWSYAIDIKNKTYEDVFNSISSKGRGHIRKALKYPLVIEDVNDNNINDFKLITEHTAKRHNHFDRTLEYYKTLISEFEKLDRIKVFVLYLDKNKYLEECKEDKLYDAIKDESRQRIPIACAMFIMDKTVVNYVYSGSIDFYNNFNASYMIQNEMLKYATERHYEVYDFGGISGNFELGSEDYGVYAFKKNFNGRVIEYIGEYDLVINKLYYFLYTKGYKLYRNSKKIFSKIKRN